MQIWEELLLGRPGYLCMHYKYNTLLYITKALLKPVPTIAHFGCPPYQTHPIQVLQSDLMH